MGKSTGIEWTHHTFNPWWGCTEVSPGCDHCYARTWAKRYGTEWGKDTPRRFFGDKHWREPLSWNVAATKAGDRRRVFCASMADVFEDRGDLIDTRKRLFELAGVCTNLDWLLLTKRPQNIRRMLPDFAWALHYPGRIWFGTSVENEANVKRAMFLCDLPGDVHFLSVEPLLGPVNLEPWFKAERAAAEDRLWDIPLWVIIGGESGAGARPMELHWAENVIAQCRAYGVSVFVKQFGAVAAKLYCLEDKKGGDWHEWPSAFRVREFPVMP